MHRFSTTHAQSLIVVKQEVMEKRKRRIDIIWASFDVARLPKNAGRGGAANYPHFAHSVA
jgi:hypothetical protein